MPNKVKTFTVLQLRAQIQKGKGAETRDPGDPRPVGQGFQNSAVPPFHQWWGSQDCGQERTGGGVENVPRREAGDPSSSTVRGRGHCAFREAVGRWLEAQCSGCRSLDLLTFPVSEEAVYSQKVIYSLIRSTSLLKRILTSCPGGGERQNSSTWSPINSQCATGCREHCPTAPIFKLGKLRPQERESWGKSQWQS